MVPFNSMKHPVLVRLILATHMLVLPGVARSDVIVNNLTQPTRNYYGPIGSDANSNDFRIGQEFLIPPGPNPYLLNEVTLLLISSSGGANITVSIWNTDANNNPFNLLAMVGTNFVATSGLVNFSPFTNIVLNPGAYYVVTAPATPADSGAVDWSYANNLLWSGTGLLGSIADDSPGYWENNSITNYPQQMSVTASPIPANLGVQLQNQQITLAWPAFLYGFVPDETTNLSPGTWIPMSSLPTDQLGTNSVTASTPGSQAFFRLRQGLVADNTTQTIGSWDGPIGTDNNNSDFLLAQEFINTNGVFDLLEVDADLIATNLPGNITARLWTAGANGNPSNPLGTIGSALVTGQQTAAFIPNTPMTLPPGTYYVELAPTTPSDNAKVGWSFCPYPAWIGFGALGNYASTSGGTWQNQPVSNGPYVIRVRTRPHTP